MGNDAIGVNMMDNFKSLNMHTDHVGVTDDGAHLEQPPRLHSLAPTPRHGGLPVCAGAGRPCQGDFLRCANCDDTTSAARPMLIIALGAASSGAAVITVDANGDNAIAVVMAANNLITLEDVRRLPPSHVPIQPPRLSLVFTARAHHASCGLLYKASQHHIWRPHR